MSKRPLHPELAKLSKDEQEKALKELEKLNNVTTVIWTANSIASKMLAGIPNSDNPFVQQKRMRLYRLLDDIQGGVEETILIL